MDTITDPACQQDGSYPRPQLVSERALQLDARVNCTYEDAERWSTVRLPSSAKPNGRSLQSHKWPALAIPVSIQSSDTTFPLRAMDHARQP